MSLTSREPAPLGKRSAFRNLSFMCEFVVIPDVCSSYLYEICPERMRWYMWFCSLRGPVSVFFGDVPF